jgi:hypothetical protein
MTDATGEALTTRLTTAERERRWPNVRPRDAATLIIIDRSGAKPKVLMGRRHTGHKFMPGKFVFPGGRIELGDRKMAVVGALHPRAEAALSARVTRPPRHLGRALALASIRETFEETGLMLGTKDYGAPDGVPEGPWGAIGPDAELIELAWVNLEEAKRLDLPTITTVILDELETRLKAGFGPELPVPFYYERSRKFQREVL